MQDASVRPEPNHQRKAALVSGRAEDHAGRVEVRPLPNFDLDRTIFKTLEGALPRFVMRSRIAKEVLWDAAPAAALDQAYDRLQQEAPLPAVSPALLRFLVEECDFDVEHADGSFLDHLYFCFEYSARHYPQRSPLVMLLHSILGTGTNTFAMEASKIPALQAHLTPFEWAQVQAFPSVLRLLYDRPLRQELWSSLGRLDQLRSVSFRRVIDNAEIELSAEDFWIQLNYQLIHLVDFLPVANWGAHRSETSSILFRDLYALLEAAKRREAGVSASPPSGGGLQRERLESWRAWLATRLPEGLSERMAARSVRTFSARVGHDLSYRLRWA